MCVGWRRLNPITTNIRQFIFDVVINPFSIRRQTVFSAAARAAQANGFSGSVYPKGRLAAATLERRAIHHIISLTLFCDGGKYCKDFVVSNKDEEFFSNIKRPAD
jgi:hypothetical protein